MKSKPGRKRSLESITEQERREIVSAIYGHESAVHVARRHNTTPEVVWRVYQQAKGG